MKLTKITITKQQYIKCGVCREQVVPGTVAVRLEASAIITPVTYHLHCFEEWYVGAIDEVRKIIESLRSKCCNTRMVNGGIQCEACGSNGL